MRLGVIDIGTNSLLLLIMEGHQVLFETARITRLGEGAYHPSGPIAIQPQPLKRTCEALRQYRQVCQQWRVDRILAYGTSILRRAANRGAVIREIERTTGLSVRVLSGEEEACYAFLSVRDDPTLPSLEGHPWLVLDIGGGSTEWVWGRERVQQVQSVAIGAVRLTEMYLPHDPPSQPDLHRARCALRDTLSAPLSRLMNALDAPPQVVGIGGTFVNLGAVILGTHVTDPNVHGLRLKRSDIQDLGEQFRGVPLAERRRIPGLEPARADIILGGTLIAQEFLEMLRIEALVISTHGVRYGMAYEYLASTEFL